MSIRSKLFATVALPVLSVSVILQPALAQSLTKPTKIFNTVEVAQADETDPAADEALKKRKKRAEQRQDDDQSKPQTDEAKPDGDAQPSREERRKKRQAEQQDDQAQPQADEAKPATEGDGQPTRQELRKRRAAEKQQQQDEQAQPQQDEAKPATDGEAPPSREERRKKREAEQQQQDEQAQPQTDEAKPATESDGQPTRQELRKRREAEKQQQQDEQAQPQTDEAKPATEGDGQPTRQELRKRREAEKQQQQDEQAQPQQDDATPATDGEQPSRDKRRKPFGDVVDKRTEDQKQESARDPAATDDTIDLPVDNGAAVLDSDKDADNSGDTSAREKRRKLRERVRADSDTVEVPKTDAEAQAGRDGRDRGPNRDEINAAISERGRRVDQVPEFRMQDEFEGQDTGGRRRPVFDREGDNRTVIDFGDQIIVRSDDRERLRRNSDQTFYDELPRGRTRETIERPGGVKVVTVYNQYGDILQRSRIDRDGRETLMIYAPEADEGPRPPSIDIGDELPPMRLRVPVQDYIIDTSSEPDRDYYDFLAEPPVEQVERVYSIDEVRNSARIRDKVRRIDLDTITFATNSSEVPLSQAKTLRKVADAMLEVIEKDPGETFLIEGHTDAVGGDRPNLVLSDERAESVASLLTDVYDIPAENLVTQGYGERFLKVRTLEAEQQNRRVTIRRVTPLVRPVAQAN